MRRRNLDDLTLARPCPVKLPPMGPDERVRHCDHCDRDVHNLSALPRVEAERLLAAPGELCVSYLRTPAGPILFDLARTAALVSAALLAACVTRGKPPVPLSEAVEQPSALTTPGAHEPLHTAEGPFRTHPDLPPDALLVAVIGPDGFPYPNARVRVVPYVAPGSTPAAPIGPDARSPPVDAATTPPSAEPTPADTSALDTDALEMPSLRRPAFGPDGGGPGPAAAEGVTNTRGHVLLRGLAPGRYVLHADGGDRGHGHADITFAGTVGLLGGVVLVQEDDLAFGGI